MGLKRGRNGAKMLIIDNFTTVMPYIRCKLNKIVTYRHYRYTWTVWNIFVTGVTSTGEKRENGAKMLIIDNFTTVMPYIRCKLNKIVNIALQIYLDSVKWKIFVTGVTKHFQGVKKGAKWGQNANYRQFHYGNAIYSLQVEQNRYISSLQIYLDSVKWKIFVTGVTKHFQGIKRGRNGAKMLIIDNFTTVMPYIRCKLNKIVTYRHYRYTWTVWNEKYSLLG